MAQHYSNPRRANDPHALPDLDVFYVHGAIAHVRQGCAYVVSPETERSWTVDSGHGG